MLRNICVSSTDMDGLPDYLNMAPWLRVLCSVYLITRKYEDSRYYLEVFLYTLIREC